MHNRRHAHHCRTADYLNSGVIKTNVSYSPNNTLKACHNTPTSNEATQENVSRNNDNTMLTSDSDISTGIYKSTNSTYGAKPFFMSYAVGHLRKKS